MSVKLKRNREETKKKEKTGTHKKWIIKIECLICDNVSGMHRISSARLHFNICASYSRMFQLSLHNRLKHFFFISSLFIISVEQLWSVSSETNILEILRCNNEPSYIKYYYINSSRYYVSLQHLTFWSGRLCEHFIRNDRLCVFFLVLSILFLFLFLVN